MPLLPLRAKHRIDFLWTLYSLSVHPSSSYLPRKIRRCWSGGIPSLSRILNFTFSTKSFGSTIKGIVFPVSVFTKIYIPQQSLWTKDRVDPFWMLKSLRVQLSSRFFPEKTSRCSSGGVPSFLWIFVLTFSIESLCWTANVIVFPLIVFMKICMLLDSLQFSVVSWYPEWSKSQKLAFIKIEMHTEFFSSDLHWDLLLSSSLVKYITHISRWMNQS